MPPGPTPPAHAFDELVAMYASAERRTRAGVAAALARGALGTAAYREAQLNSIRITLAQLRNDTPPRVLNAAARAYGGTAGAIDTVLGADPRAMLGGRFQGTHLEAVRLMAANTERSLLQAATGLQQSVEHTFELADRVDGALRPFSDLGDFLGRRVNDRARAAAMQEIATGLAAGSSRRETSAALKARITSLAGRGPADALQMIRHELTGEAQAAFIDRAGKRWNLDVYTRMVARTTTREATARATVNRMLDHGADLVTISSHASTCDICRAYDGNTYSLTGATPGYPVLDRMWPFHPNCTHYGTPAAANLEALERELFAPTGRTLAPEPAVPEPPAPDLSKLTPRRAEAYQRWLDMPESDRSYQAVAEAMGVTVPRARVYIREARHALEGTSARRRRPGDTLRERVLQPNAPPSSIPRHLSLYNRDDLPGMPLSTQAVPHVGPGAAERLEAERVAYLIGSDPGPEAGAREAWQDAVALEDRAKNHALDLALGEDLAREIDRAWGRRASIRQRLLDGDMTIEEATDDAIDEYHRREHNRGIREMHAEELRTRNWNCTVCGTFKRRPADVCAYCGDDATPLGVSPQEVNRWNGYSS